MQTSGDLRVEKVSCVTFSCQINMVTVHDIPTKIERVEMC